MNKQNNNSSQTENSGRHNLQGTNKNAGSSRKKINAVDIVILILISAFTAFVIYMIASDGAPVFALKKLFSGESSDNKKISYTVSLENCDPSLANLLKAGNSVYVNDVEIGTVERINETSPYMTITNLYERDPLTGRNVFIQNQNEDHISIVISINANAEYIQENAIYVNGIRIAIGEIYELKFPGAIAVGICTNVTFIETDGGNKE